MFEGRGSQKLRRRADHPRLSQRILRGDRIGLIGPTAPARPRCCAAGRRAGAGRGRGPARRQRLQIAYYDQQREQLDPDRTVVDTVGDGNDTVIVERPAAPRHRLPRRLPVPARARASPVKVAVGRRAQPPAAGAAVREAGQRARARRAHQRPRYRDPGAARGVDRRFDGTLLLVSHDRAFLDNVVTSTLAFEGEGRVVEYVGGYEDYLRQTMSAAYGRLATPIPQNPNSRLQMLRTAEAAGERKLVLQGGARARGAARADRGHSRRRSLLSTWSRSRGVLWRRAPSVSARCSPHRDRGPELEAH